MPAASDPCPCHPAVAYADCCGPLHAGSAQAASAEALMRSRYSAYSRGDADYLLASWHPDTRPGTLELGDAAATRWLGLEIRRHTPTAPDADAQASATVEFIARHRTGGGPAVRLHELSRFVREHGRWYYVDGAFPGA